MAKTIQTKITNVLKRNRVMDLRLLQEILGDRSRASLFRDLTKIDYFSSYSHAGRFYTLKTTPAFDSYGLWHFNDIGFSKYGNLKSTIIHFINSSKCGLKHLDLKDRLKIPVYNTLLNLVNSKQIARVDFNGSYLYVSKDMATSKLQIEMAEKRQETEINIPSEKIPPWMAIEVLTEVIRDNRAESEPLKIAARLSLRGVRVTFNQVKEVLEFYEVKKTHPTK